MVIGIAAQGLNLAPEERAALTPLTAAQGSQLNRGEILIETQPHTAWGAAVTARMLLPTSLAAAWDQVTDYPRWVQFFPDITRSEVVTARGDRPWTRIYQVATKNFLLFQAQVDIHLKVFEQSWNDEARKVAQRRIQFRMERGSFEDFSADLYLEPYLEGTLLTYQVKATPAIPVPSLFIQQAIRMDLPANLEQMRRVLRAG